MTDAAWLDYHGDLRAGVLAAVARARAESAPEADGPLDVAAVMARFRLSRATIDRLLAVHPSPADGGNGRRACARWQDAASADAWIARARALRVRAIHTDAPPIRPARRSRVAVSGAVDFGALAHELGKKTAGHPRGKR